MKFYKTIFSLFCVIAVVMQSNASEILGDLDHVVYAPSNLDGESILGGSDIPYSDRILNLGMGYIKDTGELTRGCLDGGVSTYFLGNRGSELELTTDLNHEEVTKRLSGKIDADLKGTFKLDAGGHLAKKMSANRYSRKIHFFFKVNAGKETALPSVTNTEIIDGDTYYGGGYGLNSECVGFPDSSKAIRSGDEFIRAVSHGAYIFATMSISFGDERKARDIGGHLTIYNVEGLLDVDDEELKKKIKVSLSFKQFGGKPNAFRNKVSEVVGGDIVDMVQCSLLESKGIGEIDSGEGNDGPNDDGQNYESDITEGESKNNFHKCTSAFKAIIDYARYEFPLHFPWQVDCDVFANSDDGFTVAECQKKKSEYQLAYDNGEYNPYYQISATTGTYKSALFTPLMDQSNPVRDLMTELVFDDLNRKYSLHSELYQRSTHLLNSYAEELSSDQREDIKVLKDKLFGNMAKLVNINTYCLDNSIGDECFNYFVDNIDQLDTEIDESVLSI